MSRSDPSHGALFAHVEAIFADAKFTYHLGIRLEGVGPGRCDTSLDALPEHLQQHGFVHAGVITTLADHTCGGAARAAVPPGSDVITIELKINFLRPARDRHLTCQGMTLRAGRTVIVTESEVFSGAGDIRVLVAKCSSSLLVIPQGERRPTDA